MKLHIYLLTFALLGTLFQACVPNKKLIYLQNLSEHQAQEKDSLLKYEPTTYKIQAQDILEVQIITQKDILTADFNQGRQNYASNNMVLGQIAQSGGSIYYTTGYTVDEDGLIFLPGVGEVLVSGKSIKEISKELMEKYAHLLINDYQVKVKLGGIRFAALGEFNKPGKYGVLQDRLTIFEAISQAGDLTTIAKRNDLALVRQYPDGAIVHRINLNDIDLISSPYYFIQPNDLLYVEPMKIRELGSGVNATQTLTLITSSITAVALVLTLINK
ncbi:polysaccharide biosynthesis/export family protein [Belliella kenyensis]|uniref:Polysaccharide biosynthesis/export family protein n=1 Tax=Belliella kenyensis TaxID=1472724 RepID=A0ABV8ELS6_9BACT|nr:polysaccharide biosynthesis/export family protein [Belliella kenyensis]MCH7400531.1 polysaccharide biosynthesis/export family protein [Belliella kenyensis]MDN3604453.1 polysaccharide biosynthesis/export family protein [Belliella kenyensis]